MKRFWIALGIIVIILAVSCWGLYRLDSIIDELNSTLQQLETAVGQQDFESTMDLSQQFLEQWKDHQNTLERYIHHEALDEVTGLAAQLPALAAYKQYPLLSAQTARLKELLHHVREAEFPTLTNIF